MAHTQFSGDRYWMTLSEEQKVPIAIFLITGPTNGGVADYIIVRRVGGIDQTWAASMHGVGAVPLTDILGQRLSDSKGPNRRYEFWCPSVEPNEQVMAHLIVMEPCRGFPKIAPTKGAKVYVEDAGMEIISVSPQDPQSASKSPMRADQKVWDVAVQTTNPNSRITLTPLMPLSAEGEPIHVDRKGKPVTGAVKKPGIGSGLKSSAHPGSATFCGNEYREAELTESNSSGTNGKWITHYRLNVDPRYLSHLCVQARRLKFVRLGGIRLAPR